MSAITERNSAHSKGEVTSRPENTPSAWPLDTPGGRFYAEWEPDAPTSREGQLMFFFQFLNAGGRWKRFMQASPLHYSGNRGSKPLDVMGTVLLSVLCGHWRYAHINSVRGDRVNASLLGMDRTVSEDVVRDAMKRIPEAEGLSWLRTEILDCISPVLELPWILDIDSTIKPIYGHQQGAQMGYNPHKPGRPSHVYHSYFVANLRISLGVDVLPGKQHAASYGMSYLWELLDELPRSRWPTFARGDCGYGNEALMSQFEERGLPYLFKLMHSPKVKELVNHCLRKQGVWQDTGDGWQVMEVMLKLGSWSRERRVILVRESPAVAPVGEGARRRRDHLDLPLRDGTKWPESQAPWSGKIAVLVTSLDERSYPTISMARLYRERADAENNFDELKNQWGWSGYTTQKLAPSRLMANMVALFYNWWNLYVRFYDEEHHREAITSRPALMQGVARQVQGGGQRKMKISIVHEKAELIMSAVRRISGQLQEFVARAEGWTIEQRWATLLTRLLRRLLGGKWLNGVPESAALMLSG